MDDVDQMQKLLDTNPAFLSHTHESKDIVKKYVDKFQILFVSKFMRAKYYFDQ